MEEGVLLTASVNPTEQETLKPGPSRWLPSLKKHQRPVREKALWQVTNTFALFIFCWWLMIGNLRGDHIVWVHLGLVTITAGLQIRLFILFHDCCHQALFPSRRANMVLGHLLGVLTYTPYESWRRTHGIHHNTAGNLDRRGRGDVWLMTVEEYRGASTFKRMTYRFFRNPVVMLVLGPIWLFLIEYRFPGKGDRRKQIISLHITNAGIVAVIVLATWLLGWQTYLLVQVPVNFIAGAGGIWLFYVQHQFEDVYWSRQPVWDPVKAALQGSSFYQLPRLLQWFSANIGYHHLHHLLPRIPNYHLEGCHYSLAQLQTVKPLTLRDSLGSLRLKLWHEEKKRLVGFETVRSARSP